MGTMEHAAKFGSTCIQLNLVDRYILVLEGWFQKAAPVMDMVRISTANLTHVLLLVGRMNLYIT